MNKAAEFERDIDRVLGRWVEQRAGSALLGRAASALGRAEGQGHVRCDMTADAGFAPAQIAELRRHAWVGTGDAFTPFVAAGDANLYTWRNWRNESRLAQALLKRAAARTLPVDGAQLAADVNELFAGMDAQATHWQRAAVAAVPGARAFVLAGGPGTGKTTTVLRMLLMLLKHAETCGWAQNPAIALSAPTGKAAQRLTEAIAAGRVALGAQLDAESPFASLLVRLAGVQARTLHRLLGFDARTGEFAFNDYAPLPADIVIVDEASMIDQAMMWRLFDALKPHATLILLGDPAQLYAIEAGSVLGDVVGSVTENALPSVLAQRLSTVIGDVQPADSAAPLTGQIITLSHGWRARVGLRDVLAAIRAGDSSWLEGALAANTAGDLRWFDCAEAKAVHARVRDWLGEHATWFANLLRRGIEPTEAISAVRRAQILCALREGPFGAACINALTSRELAARFGLNASDTWHRGRPVIVTRNDPARGLYNGDVGIALQGADGLRVWFDGIDGAPRGFSPRALPAHETAWAITIHRSQGSEYDHVAVLLPPDIDNRILCRELVYTAVSRAREAVQIWSSADALCAALGRPVMRRSGLGERLTASNPARR